MVIDPYMLDIAEKDVSSARLAELALPTLEHDYVKKIIPGKNGLSFLQIPPEFVLVGHSSGGDYSIQNPSDYAVSVVKRLVRDSRKIGALPVAMADVIDARSTDLDFVDSVGIPMADLAQKYGVAILNGELAKYGAMMNCPCNITGTMLGLLNRRAAYADQGVFEVDGIKYFVIDPKGKMIWMNSDGTGTNTLIKGRFGKFNLSYDDMLAMLADDKAKFGGGAVALFGLLEHNRADFPVRQVLEYADGRAREQGLVSILQPELVRNRLVGPHGEKIVYNMSGNLVSRVDNDITEKMPKPKAGDYLIAVKGFGRSNGFTDRRNLVAEWFGNNWHKTQGGAWFGEFLSKSSIVFYKDTVDLFNKKIISLFTHMSGGAFRDKLAKQIKKFGFYAEIGLADGSPQLYKPDPREAAIAAQFKLEDAHTKFAMCNEGFFVAVDGKQEEVLAELKARGYEAKIVCRLEEGKGRVGLKFRASCGDVVDFSEKAA